MELWFTAFIMVSNLLLTDADLTYNETTLTAEQEKNVVTVLKITKDEDWKSNHMDFLHLAIVLDFGIGEVAEKLITTPAKLTITVVQRTTERLDLSVPFEFFVSTPYEIIDGNKLNGKANDMKSAIERLLKNWYPDMEYSVSVVGRGQGLAAWAIVLIVIAVLLVVGAASFLVFGYYYLLHIVRSEED